MSRRKFMSVVEGEIIDLSLQNKYGSPTTQTTANCYVVSAAGKYKFPCVYGNAINEGSTNATAYTKNSGSYSHAFVNYKGTQIVSPYIATDTGETIASAQLSIADTNNIFTNIALEGSGASTYVTFKVASVPDTGANGVISIKNSSGTIMWNWHIWVWKDSLATVTITNSKSKTYKILPVNLASKWVSSSNSPTQITNWYYQWGRSVPLTPAATYVDNTNATTYGALSFTIASQASNYQSGIINPTTFYKNNSLNSSNFNWFSSGSYYSYYNLWDQACTDTGCSDNTVVKTVYDPCPPGFRMPNGNTFTGFSASNVVGSFTNGYYFKKNSSDTTGVFFPASGCRGGSGGVLRTVGNYGYVWSAAAKSQSYAYKLLFSSGVANPQSSDFCAYGHSVRPVVDEQTPEYSITWITQSGSWTEAFNSSAYDRNQWTSVSPGSSGSTVIRCTFSGVTSITFNCVYNGENNYDYLTVGSLDTACTRSSYGTSLKGASGIARELIFTCDKGEHYVEFCYSKDGSGDTSPDCAVVYVKSVTV